MFTSSSFIYKFSFQISSVFILNISSTFIWTNFQNSKSFHLKSCIFFGFLSFSFSFKGFYLVKVLLLYKYFLNLYFIRFLDQFLLHVFIQHLQIKEFLIMGFSINDSVYSSLFFFLTGLHFFHIILGLLLCCLFFCNCSFKSTPVKPIIVGQKILLPDGAAVVQVSKPVCTSRH